MTDRDHDPQAFILQTDVTGTRTTSETRLYRINSGCEFEFCCVTHLKY